MISIQFKVVEASSNSARYMKDFSTTTRKIITTMDSNIIALARDDPS